MGGPIRSRPCQSKTEFAVGTKADELQHFGIGLPVDQHEVGLDVAVAAILPVADQRMVAVPLAQRLVVRQRRHDLDEVAFQRCPMLTLCFAFVVTFELSGALNRPHSDLPSAHRLS